MQIKRGGGSDRFRKSLQELSEHQVEVGFFENAKYPDGTPVAYVAAIQEFGSPQNNIPARSFMRPTMHENRVHYIKQMAGASKVSTRGDVKFLDAFGAVGGLVAGDISRAISRVTEPKLKESTLRARQSRKKTKGVSKKPLVDSGLMIQSVTWKVEKI